MTPARLAACLASLAFLAPAAAQEAPAPRLGLGISIETGLLGSLVPLGNAVFAPPVMLHLPVAVTPWLRLEPSIGVARVTDRGSRPEVTSDAFGLGLGALYLRPVAPQVNLLAGLRLGIVWLKDQAPATTPQPLLVEAKQTILQGALVLGGEYLPTPWFSIGLEGQLVLSKLGDADMSGGGSTSSVAGGSALSTNALAFLRVYFF